eukprot:GEMP01036720.1.p1 GENE.GEMP01036720.1~~GEMP01036720.1.p1  ORF type:complete len:301 (+),score=34.47 GEMP01036720.1:35-937(+)
MVAADVAALSANRSVEQPKEKESHLGCADDPHFDWIFVGDKDGAKDLQALRENNIKYVLNCTPPRTSGGVSNYHEKSGITYCRLPMNDNSTESLSFWWEKAWEFLELVRVREDGCVLVHCNLGVSRSTSMVISYMIKYFRKSFDDALKIVVSGRSKASPNESFTQQLKDLHAKLTENDAFIETSPRNLKRELDREAAFSKRRCVRGPAGPPRGPAGPAGPPRVPTGPTMPPTSGHSVGPAMPPSGGPSVDPAMPPTVGPAMPPTVGPAMPPTVGPAMPPVKDTSTSIGPSVGPALPPSLS